MEQQTDKPSNAPYRVGSLRRRVIYSLAIVRLILVPVIFLAIYYLFRMGWIVDRIVSVDAPAATMAQQASIQMLEARRAERNYFLLHDPAYLQANRESVSRLNASLANFAELQPEQADAVERALEETKRYSGQFEIAAGQMAAPGQETLERVRAVVRAYEKDLDALLRDAQRKPRARLVESLRDRVGSFDAQITETVQTKDPILREATANLEQSSRSILQLASNLESQSWKQIQEDHQEARRLMRQAEWALTIVSVLTFILSVWVSLVLPRQVAKPLVDLKNAVDRAAAGNYELNLEFQGEGEIVELAKSVSKLIEQVKAKT
jgi:nitrogen fixation/metabolism regulation signal transduction histidine kinase